MHIKRSQLSDILSSMLLGCMISVDQSFDIIEWEGEQKDFLTNRYLTACRKDILAELLEEIENDINIDDIYHNTRDFISDLKETLYLHIESEVREPIIEILTAIYREDEKHRRAEHEHSQAEIY